MNNHPVLRMLAAIACELCGLLIGAAFFGLTVILPLILKAVAAT